MIRPFLLFLAFAGAASAQQPALVGDTAHGFRITSQVLGQTRKIDVVLPPSFARTSAMRRYPVAVVFDGESNMRTIAEVGRELSGNGMIPEMIYVGIENVDPMRGRVFDLTPPGLSVSGSNLEQGGDKFLDFIERELLPAVDRELRGSEPRIVIGHSSGGILATYAAATRPGFRGVISIDAPVQLQKEWLVDKLQARAAKKDTPPLRFASFEARFPWPDAAWKRVTSAAPPTWSMHHETLRLEGHETVFFLAAYLGLREIFSDYSRLAAQNTRATDMIAYYANIGTQLGSFVVPPRRILGDLVDDLVSVGRGREARAAFEMLNRGYGPPADSARIASEIAEAERLPAPKETVEELLATPFPTPAEARPFVGEWLGGIWFGQQPHRDNVRFRVRVENGKVVAETNNTDAPPEMAGWKAVDYLRITKDGLTWGRLNGMRPRGVMLFEGVRRGDTLSGTAHWGGVSVNQPEQPGFAFVRKAP